MANESDVLQQHQVFKFLDVTVQNCMINVAQLQPNISGSSLLEEQIMSVYFIISERCHITNICCSSLSAASHRKPLTKFSLGR
jgi:hypothetical protein